MSEDRKKLGMILREEGLITKEQLIKALKVQKVKGGSIGDILVRLQYITKAQRDEALGSQYGMEWIDFDDVEVLEDVIEKVRIEIVRQYQCMPVDLKEDGTIRLAVTDPNNLAALDDLNFMLNCPIDLCLTSEESLRKAVEKYYGGDDSVEDLLMDLEEPEMDDDYLEEQSSAYEVTTDLQAAVNDAPVIKLLNYYLHTAISKRTSDIHFEPFEDDYKVRMRIDGALLEMQSPPRNIAPALSARVKVMADLDIAETRLPMDGRIDLTMGGRPIQLRVSTLPTLVGESVVLRVLDKQQSKLDIEQIGMREDELEIFRELCALPNGIVLVTGPTGSGKTTTLYSALNEANDVSMKLITTEDPVEYDLPGIMQVQVNPSIGVTFASCLRSILRQDPDKVLVGEIRDLETAQIAIEASLTGHLVFSTLHTNDAPLTISRLVDMGIERFNVAATLEAVIAQRLVRTICLDCKEEYEPDEESLFLVGLKPDQVSGKQFYMGKGCDNCFNTGYRNRMAIFEILRVNDEVREMILAGASSAELADAARRHGMRTLRDSGILAVYDGRTTIEEVVRCTA